MPDEGVIQQEATPEPVAGEKPTEKPGKVYQQNEVDKIMESVRATERKRIEAENAEKQRQSEMSEAEKLAARLAEVQSRADAAESVLVKAQRLNDLLGRTTPEAYVPRLYLQDAVESAGDEWDAEKAFTAARAKWEQDSGHAQPAANGQGRRQPPAAQRSGAAGSTNPNQFDNMTPEAFREAMSAHLRSGKVREAQRMQEEVKAWKARGGRFVGE